MSGKFASAAPAAATNVELFAPDDAAGAESAILSMCNQTDGEVAVRVAITDSGLPSLGRKDWIEYDAPIPPHGVLERTGLVISNPQSLVVHTNTDGVSFVLYGFEENN